jgi:hypothetical protein
MAILSRPLPARQILAREPVQRPRMSRRVVVIGVMVAVVLTGLAWIDGGEESLHPIAQEVVLPGAGQ